MTLRTQTLPDPARSEARLALFSTWHVGTPERQRAACDAVAHAWLSRAWPHEGLLSYSVYEGTDGATLLHHSQWRDETAHGDFVRAEANGRQERNAEIDRAVPGIERLGLLRTRRYRSGRFDDGAFREILPGEETVAPETAVGAIVVVRDVLDGPDPKRQRGLVDAVFDALLSDPQPVRGALSSYFHLTTDGTTMLNYAEWETEQAHVDALATPGPGIGSPTPQWRRVMEFPGRAEGAGDVSRYRLRFQLVPGQA